ncbi:MULTISPECIES: metalloregulator ArsR/SmtB family transcription factor [Sphingomonas]|uniref:DNA-binding transcriptional regulator, ArsR family n=1 Tax=Sphingomonas carotinifaciens TaxID=1166323 RepID=A0A1G7MFG5_9SPHN|nr:MULTISPECIES: metalloregulator ArsR/SmtB family transcription factor [Sphingomonas]MBB4086847.1 DNA-binding transcriptional ArsR family regulator [Sphingomonas carotinifaciens]MWC42049.1 metalloregulator ArsR/SmtB family transcription factor [Sphingomonas carotinifaciens]SDF60376.1 DNA-binding transcriptional regulator, ArsR family [Sphingomonas carotinifaciens]
MTQDEGTQLAELFRLLGEPNRLRLVVACLEGPRSVGDLTEQVGVSQSLVSQHLRLLRAGRLLKQTRSGRNVFYELPDCHIRTMLTNMMDHVLEPEDHNHEE